MKTFTVLPWFAILAACGSSPATRSNSQTVDPAIGAALADPLMADPGLDRRSNKDALRPADQPNRALVPPGAPDPLRAGAPATLIARARPQLGGGFTGCAFDVRYSYGWAARLPAELTLPGEAQVAEAAGSDAPRCNLRLVAYSSPIGPEAAADGYRRLARARGYALSERKLGPATVLVATRASDGAAFMASVTAPDGGSAVDLASNRGR